MEDSVFRLLRHPQKNQKGPVKKMKYKSLSSYIIVSILICIIHFDLKASQYPSVQIENSKAIGFTSNINNTDYELQIALPSRYSESKKHYPVVYLLDANNDFPLVTSISRRLYQEDNLDPIIVVGISYKKNAYINRIKDYTPTKTSDKRTTGQANEFIEVFKKEIFPLIDSNFRTQINDRTIAGHSLGGLFGAYQIIKDESLFNRYIISSASVWWDNFKTLSFEQESYKKPTQIFISVGSEEGDHMKESATKLTTLIREKMPQSEMKIVILSGETHGTAKFRAYADSLRWLFKGSHQK
jgi:predicted alpha/beta superfamily hydrolase